MTLRTNEYESVRIVVRNNNKYGCSSSAFKLKYEFFTNGTSPEELFEAQHTPGSCTVNPGGECSFTFFIAPLAELAADDPITISFWLETETAVKLRGDFFFFAYPTLV